MVAISFIDWALLYLHRKPQVISIEDTIKKIIDERCSVSRYGDGELEIMMGKNLDFQTYNDRLALRLKKILHIDKLQFIVCLPDVFSTLDKYCTEGRDYWKKNLKERRRHWYELINMEKVYYNSFISRLYWIFDSKDHSSEMFMMLKFIWNERDMVIIEGAKSRLGVRNDLFNNARSIKRILCPAENAYSKYNLIIKEACKVEKGSLLLIALGPTATVMAFDLHELGYQAIDIGHLDIEYEWFLARTNTRIPISGKYTNETLNGRDVGELTDAEYQKQVIAEIK